MGSAWKRLIGIVHVCRILDSLLFEVCHSKLAHNVLTIFLAEVIHQQPPDCPGV